MNAFSTAVFLPLLAGCVWGQLMPIPPKDQTGGTPKEVLGNSAVRQIQKQNAQAVKANAAGMSLAQAQEFVKLHAADANLSSRIFTVELEYKDIIQLFNSIEPARNTRILTETADTVHGLVEREAARLKQQADAEKEAAQTRHDTWAMVRNIFVMALGAIVTWLVKWWKLDPDRRNGERLKIDDAAVERNADLLGHVKEVVANEHKEVAQTVTAALVNHAVECEAGKVAAVVSGKLVEISRDVADVKERTHAWSGQQP